MLCNLYMIQQNDYLKGQFKEIFYLNRKYFNPLVSGPGRFEWWKKTGGRWKVPITNDQVLVSTVSN